MKLIIDIDEDDYTMCQILAKEMCDTRMKLTDNLKYAISNGIPLDNLRAEIEQRKKNSGGEPNRDLAFNVCLQIIDRYKERSE